MTNINEKSEWSTVVQLEDGDILKGGETGLANEQAKALANRTTWLKNAVEAGGGVSGASNAGIPTGTIISWAGSTAPAGFTECKGQSLDTTAFSSLFSAIGYTWGGSGNTFKLPDFYTAGRFLRSRTASLTVGTTQEDAIRNITGTLVGVLGDTNTIASGVFNKTSHTKNAGYTTGSANGGMVLDINTSLQVPTADENRPKNAAVMYCVKVTNETPEQAAVQDITTKVNYTDYTSGSNANGKWRKEPDGTIIQTGNFVCNAQGYVTVTFPIPFTTKCDYVNTVPVFKDMVQSTSVNTVLYDMPALTSFTVYGRYIAQGGTVSAATVCGIWEARGK